MQRRRAQPENTTQARSAAWTILRARAECYHPLSGSNNSSQGAAVQHFNASDGVRLAYTIDDFTDPWLKAPTLLLLHAAMGHSKRYYAWVPKLCRHYRVVRMDLRGHGASEVPPAEPALTMERLVQDTREML